MPTEIEIRQKHNTEFSNEPQDGDYYYLSDGVLRKRVGNKFIILDTAVIINTWSWTKEIDTQCTIVKKIILEV